MYTKKTAPLIFRASLFYVFRMICGDSLEFERLPPSPPHPHTFVWIGKGDTSAVRPARSESEAHVCC